MAVQFKSAKTVLTLGEKGSVYAFEGATIQQEAFRVEAVDTTAAGDTFTGYLLSAISRGLPIQDCLTIAAKASAMAVMQKGAAPSIPYWDKVMTAKIS